MLKEIRAENFLLSHFHFDHYSGLFQCEPQSTVFKRVYFPRIPEFPRNEELVCCLLAMAKYCLGDVSGSQEYDLISEIKRINFQSPFSAIPLSAGDKIKIDGEVIEVLWPPKRLQHGLRMLGKAIEIFNRVKNSTPKLKRIYDALKKEESTIAYYCSSESLISEGRIKDQAKEQPETPHPQRLPRNIEQANDALRSVANQLSLAFRVGSDLLFWGDLESSQLRDTLNNLPS